MSQEGLETEIPWEKLDDIYDNPETIRKQVLTLNC
jgi:hypothetical protein